MLDQTFIFKNKRAKAKGIELQEAISVSAAVPNFTEYKIPGRSGALIEYDGTYQNRTITALCYLLDYAMENGIDDINAWLLSGNGYFRFEDTEDTKHFMLARSTNGIEKKVRMGMLNAFLLEFDAKPQRYLKLGEKPVEVSTTKSIYNPTAFPALPLLEIDGSGNITVVINNVELTVNDLDGVITYDAETDNAYNGAQNMNGSIYVGGSILLPPGKTDISFVSGTVSSLKITPRWWEL